MAHGISRCFVTSILPALTAAPRSARPRLERRTTLIPLLADVAAGKLGEIAIYGDNWPTPDGTGVRDYIHVMDLAAAHVAALAHLATTPGLIALNLGTGRGHSVLELIAAFERACGRAIPRRIAPRRPGDVAAYYADPSRAETLLGVRARRDIDAICTDAWRWQTQRLSE